MNDIRFRSEMTVELIDHMGNDASVVRAARVSTKGAASRGEQADRGLINYLTREFHGSPLEHTAMTFLVEAPIFVARQMMRHRAGVSFNETSGRYRELEPVFYMPDEARPLVQHGKVGEYTFTEGTEDQYGRTASALVHSARGAWDAYQRMLHDEVAREVARAVLPTSIYTSFFMTVNARSLLHFLSLRTPSEHSSPQHEIAKVASLMEQAFADLFPITYEAWTRHGRKSI